MAVCQAIGCILPAHNPTKSLTQLRDRYCHAQVINRTQVNLSTIAHNWTPKAYILAPIPHPITPTSIWIFAAMKSYFASSAEKIQPMTFPEVFPMDLVFLLGQVV